MESTSNEIRISDEELAEEAREREEALGSLAARGMYISLTAHRVYAPPFPPSGPVAPKREHPSEIELKVLKARKLRLTPERLHNRQ